MEGIQVQIKPPGDPGEMGGSNNAGNSEINLGGIDTGSLFIDYYFGMGSIAPFGFPSIVEVTLGGSLELYLDEDDSLNIQLEVIEVLVFGVPV